MAYPYQQYVIDMVSTIHGSEYLIHDIDLQTNPPPPLEQDLDSENQLNSEEKVLSDSEDNEEENNENPNEDEDEEDEEDEEQEESEEESVEDVNQAMTIDATASGEDLENEGGQATSLNHDGLIADVFDDDFSLDLDSGPDTILVHLDEDEIREFYLETIADDPNAAGDTSGDIFNLGTDSYSGVGNTVIDVSAGNNVNNFKSFAALFAVGDEIALGRLFDNVPAVKFVGSVLDNDTGQGLKVLGAQNITEGAIVNINEDGTFQYVPPPGLTNTIDSFEYLVQDMNGNQGIGQVNINLNNMIWYIDNSNDSAGTGTSADPFNSFDIFISEKRPDQPGDNLFIRAGKGTYQSNNERQEEYQPLPNQKIFGEGAPLVIDDVLLFDQGQPPLIEQNDFLNPNDIIGVNLGPRGQPPPPAPIDVLDVGPNINFDPLPDTQNNGLVEI